MNIVGNWFWVWASDTWNIFDLVVVVASIVADLSQDFPNLTVLRTARVFRVIRLFKRLKALRAIVNAIAAAAARRALLFFCPPVSIYISTSTNNHHGMEILIIKIIRDVLQLCVVYDTNCVVYGGCVSS
jgi:hypothetical protein